jgi:hypothetical protein
MSTIDEILELLSDGEWHNITEISKSLKMPFEELDSIIHFLSKYGFVEIGDDLIKVKMEKDFKELVTEEFQEVEEIKPKPEMLMSIKGQFKTIESTDSEIVITGSSLEIESMKKPEKEAKPEKPELVNMNDVLHTLRFLTDNEWHRYDEITSKLQLTTEKLLELIKVLKENDLVVVHDKFGMLRLRQEIKIQQ